MVAVLGFVGLGSVRLTVRLNDVKGLFRPKQFYDFMILIQEEGAVV